MRLFWLMFIGVFICTGLLHAQEAGSTPSPGPGQAIRELKAGTLIVRLPSNRRKMEALRSELEKEEEGTVRHKWLAKELATTKEETDTFNLYMYRAFQEAYDFSAVQFTYDYFTPQLKTGDLAGALLNEQLQPDNRIAPPDGPYYLLRFGQTQKDYSDGIEAMVVMTPDLKNMAPPFPYYQRLNDFTAFIGSIFPRDDQKLFDALRLVGKLNARLKKFYNQQDEKG
ncbi:hypothetical protein [Phaeodactylibacter luteus]|uniref:Uncharacterized protein n=1 Tax=Phaeodactylibacter luteus TaxID=1564516 RepID=A0A5C6RK01_9BACT|nr:hypothetical protein [Phaeodactylibacter luteus]TXB61662.1 hypothetical protein FRY97_17935 [Phaeodactylibacter luteus]